MTYTIKDADLLDMPLTERNKVLASLVAAAKAPRNGQATMIEARIRHYELRYEMSSEKLLEVLAADPARETAEIADWLFWVNLRNSGSHGQART